MTPPTVPRELVLAFAPLHKRAFGIACGLVSGTFFFLLTAVYLLRAPADAFRLELLGEYFAGFTVSWSGALVALAWGFVAGFVAGWFTAFCRNLIIAFSLFVSRTRAELSATRDFLDHI